MTAHTAAELRERAEWISHLGNDLWAQHRITHAEAVKIGETASMLRQAADAMEAGVWISHEMNDFLHGSGPLEGKWFGEIDQISDRPFSRKVMYWWRKLLPESRATKAMKDTP